MTEPLWAWRYKDLGTYLLGVHRLDEAERAMDKAIELQPTVGNSHVWLTVIKIQRGLPQGWPTGTRRSFRAQVDLTNPSAHWPLLAS